MQALRAVLKSFACPLLVACAFCATLFLILPVAAHDDPHNDPHNNLRAHSVENLLKQGKHGVQFVIKHSEHDHTVKNARLGKSPEGITETCHLRGCQELVGSLVQFIDTTYQIYDPKSKDLSIATLPLPEVHFISRKDLSDKACPTDYCDAIGWFPNKEDIVYLAADQDVMHDLNARSILLHELVHYVQHKIGSPVGENECLTWKAREMQAYGIQYHWLRVNRVRVGTPAYNLRLASYSRMTCDEDA